MPATCTPLPDGYLALLSLALDLEADARRLWDFFNNDFSRDPEDAYTARSLEDQAADLRRSAYLLRTRTA